MTKLIIGALAVTFVALGTFTILESARNNMLNENSSDTSQKADEENNSNTINVSLSGEIRKNYPAGGTFKVPLNSTLADLLEAAGGVTTNADPKAYDASIVLRDKQSFYIAPIYDNTDVCSTMPIEKVNINSGSKDQLMSVRAISSTLAESIISYRNKNGRFETIEDIKNVKGIGSATFEKIKNFIQIID